MCGLRAEGAAALANSLVVALIALGLMMASTADGAHLYSNPTKAAFQTAALLAIVTTPFALIAFWRTWVHAHDLLTRGTTGWRGVLEAGAFGFALTLPFVLPGVVARQFNPEPWGQPDAFFLGVAYVGVYGLLGLGVGLAFGFVLRFCAMLVLRFDRRFPY